MRAAVIVFPGSNCDRDVAVALTKVTGQAPMMVWHSETELPPDLDLVVLPGGFSYGDYLRSGAIASQSPVMSAVRGAAREGRMILGICNGFQILTEVGLLPGALIRNAGLTFISRTLTISVERQDTPFTIAYAKGQTLQIPVAHHDGNYTADTDVLDRLEGEGQVAFRYHGENPNGSARSIAGITDGTGRILGLMPHPERAIETVLGSTDGRGLFESLVNRMPEDRISEERAAS